MPIHFLEPLNRAWGRMKAALFRPFDIHKWFVVGFSAFLAALLEGNNSGGSGRIGKEGNFDEFIHFPRVAWEWLQDNPGWAIAILFAVLVTIAVLVALTWVSSRGVFMFMDNVVRDRAEIARPWREYQKEGDSLFVWRLVDKGAVRHNRRSNYALADGSASALEAGRIPCNREECWWSIQADPH